VNANQLAHQAYGSASLRTPRQAEYQVLSAVTARLGTADAQGDFPRLVGALHDNSRLWTRFAAEVAGAANGLPQDLRARIFYLAEFTRAHTRRVLKGEAEAQPLIDINTAVMRGLSGASQATAPAAPSNLAAAPASRAAPAGGVAP
jgi:flagellar protein FlaF